jgi:tRNA (guanine37-N1)-methyltransferase
VPVVLTSGDHGAVRRWRLKAALHRTRERRPDLLAGRVLSAEEAAFLGEPLESTAPAEPPEPSAPPAPLSEDDPSGPAEGA